MFYFYIFLYFLYFKYDILALNIVTINIIVTIEDALLAERRVSVLMGDNVEPRKNWIDENVDFSLEDDYQIEMK